MKNKIILSFIALVFCSASIKSQCLTGTLDGTINVTGVFQVTTVPVGSPSYFHFNGLAGATYIFSYCQGGGSYAGDPYITIADNVPSALTFNDDFCSLGSEINSWVCPANGVYRMYTSGCCPCGVKPAGLVLAYKRVLPACSGAPASSTAIATPSALCGAGNSTINLNVNYPFTGITHQWQSSAVGAGPYNNIPGANGPAYNANLASTMFYQCVVTCTNSGLSINSETVQVTVSQAPTVNIVSTPTMCSGGTVNLTANGAASYSWSNGAATASVAVSPSANVIYTVVGTSANGCTASASQPVTVYANPSVSITGGSVVSCAGASVNLVVSGANSYSWNTGANTASILVTPTVNTTYTVTGSSTLTTCSSLATIIVTVNALPSLTVAGSGTTCPGRSINLGVSGAVTYTWNPGNLNGFFVSVTPSVSTNYTVIGTSASSCTNSATVNVLVVPCAGLHEQSAQMKELSVYPNPASGVVTIELKNGLNKIIDVMDVTGRVVLSHLSSSDKTDLNISALAEGIYYVKVQSKDGAAIVKIAKQ